jgi:hypothetical protein
MDIILLMFSITFLAAASYIAIAHLCGCTAAMIWKYKGIDRGYSTVAGASLILCFVAWLSRSDTIGLWAFLPAAADPGTWSLLILPFFLAWRWSKGEW